MEGFLVSDYAHRFDEAAVRLSQWVAEGKIRWREDVTEGLENAPRAFMGMLNGENRGKALVKVAEPSSGRVPRTDASRHGLRPLSGDRH